MLVYHQMAFVFVVWETIRVVFRMPTTAMDGLITLLVFVLMHHSVKRYEQKRFVYGAIRSWQMKSRSQKKTWIVINVFLPFGLIVCGQVLANVANGHL